MDGKTRHGPLQEMALTSLNYHAGLEEKNLFNLQCYGEELTGPADGGVVVGSVWLHI